MPATTMRRIFGEIDLWSCDQYKLVVGYLSTYQRQGDNRAWDTFRNKLPPDLLKLWGDLIIECRRNGFIRPRSDGENIIWWQVVGHGGNGDLCTMCERECTRRNYVDSGDAKGDKLTKQDFKKKQEPCWKISHPVETEYGESDS